MKLSKSRENTLMAIGRGAIINDAIGQKAAKWLVANGLALEFPNWCCFRLTGEGKDILEDIKGQEMAKADAKKKLEVM